jgi:hypothetical protein
MVCSSAVGCVVLLVGSVVFLGVDDDLQQRIQ